MTARRRRGKLTHRLELALGLALLPTLVVEVLLAVSGIEAGRLQVAEWIGADPDLLPGRRDRQLANTLERLLVIHPLAIGVAITEAVAGPKPSDPLPAAVRPPQTTASPGLSRA